MTNFVHKGDLPDNVKFQGDVAVDTEAMGLDNVRDRLCVVQLSDGEGDVHLVQFERDNYDAPNLNKVLSDPAVTKIFHYARFDVAILKRYLGVWCMPIYCTKIASKLARTYTDYHGLKDLCRELLGVQLSKHQQSSDWGLRKLSKEQVKYAASDVLYLHQLREELNSMLQREERFYLLQSCCDFMQHRVELDMAGWIDKDIFSHSSS
jgi:ribonuclease D